MLRLSSLLWRVALHLCESGMPWSTLIPAGTWHPRAVHTTRSCAPPRTCGPQPAEASRLHGCRRSRSLRDRLPRGPTSRNSAARRGDGMSTWESARVGAGGMPSSSSSEDAASCAANRCAASACGLEKVHRHRGHLARPPLACPLLWPHRRPSATLGGGDALSAAEPGLCGGGVPDMSRRPSESRFYRPVVVSTINSCPKRRSTVDFRITRSHQPKTTVPELQSIVTSPFRPCRP
jgi:hypothetical protein